MLFDKTLCFTFVFKIKCKTLKLKISLISIFLLFRILNNLKQKKIDLQKEVTGKRLIALKVKY